MYFCTVNGNSRVMCTLSSAHLQQASKRSALWRFESIRKDCDKYAYQHKATNGQTDIKHEMCLFINSFYFYVKVFIKRQKRPKQNHKLAVISVFEFLI